MSAAPGTLRVRVGAGLTRTVIDRALGKVPLVVLQPTTWAQLRQECGSDAKAAAWLLKTATRRRRPIGLYADGTTTFIAPAGWSAERLGGYVAAQHDVLEQAFGPVARLESRGAAP